MSSSSPAVVGTRGEIGTGTQKIERGARLVDVKFRDVIQNLQNTHQSVIEMLYPCFLFTPCQRDHDEEAHASHHQHRLNQSLQQCITLWSHWKPVASTEDVVVFNKRLPMPLFPQFEMTQLEQLDPPSQLVFKKHTDKLGQVAHAMQQTCTSWWNLANQVHDMIFASLRNVGLILSVQHNAVWSQLHATSQRVYLHEAKAALDILWKNWLAQKEQLVQHGQDLYSRWFAHVAPSFDRMESVLKSAHLLYDEGLWERDQELEDELDVLVKAMSCVRGHAESLRTASNRFWINGGSTPVLASLLLSAERWWHDFYYWFLHLIQVSQVQSMAKQKETQKAQETSTQPPVQHLLLKMQHFELKTPLEANQEKAVWQEVVDAKNATTWLHGELKKRTSASISNDHQGWSGLRLLLQGCRDLAELKVEESHKVFAEMQKLYKGWEAMARDREQLVKKLLHQHPDLLVPSSSSASDEVSSSNNNTLPGAAWVGRLLKDDPGRPDDPRVLEAMNNLTLELDRLRHEMAFVQRQLNQTLIPDYLDRLTTSRHLQETLSIMEHWVDSCREGWLALAQEEMAYIQNCTNLRFRLFDGFQDAHNALVQGTRYENRVHKNALRLLVQHVFAQHLERHDVLLSQLEQVWRATQTKMRQLADASHQINRQMSLVSPRFATRVLEFNSKVGQTVENIQRQLEKNYTTGFNVTVQEHSNAMQHFLHAAEQRTHPLQHLATWMDQICDSLHETRKHISEVMLQHNNKG